MRFGKGAFPPVPSWQRRAGFQQPSWEMLASRAARASGTFPRGAGTRGSQDFRVPTLPQSIRTVPDLPCPLRPLSLPLGLSLASAGRAIFLALAHAPGGLCAEPGLTHLTAFPPGKFTELTHLPPQRSRPACGVELLFPGAAWLSAHL